MRNFEKYILTILMFFAMSNSAFANIRTCECGDIKNSNRLICVNPERLFFENGKLFLDTRYGGILPLESISYSEDRCYTNTICEK